MALFWSLSLPSGIAKVRPGIRLLTLAQAQWFYCLLSASAMFDGVMTSLGKAMPATSKPGNRAANQLMDPCARLRMRILW